MNADAIVVSLPPPSDEKDLKLVVLNLRRKSAGKE